MIYSSKPPAWVILVVVIGVAAVIGGAAFLIHYLLKKNKKNKDVKPTEEEIADQNVSRFVVDVEDKETQEEFKRYQNEKDNK